MNPAGRRSALTDEDTQKEIPMDKKLGVAVPAALIATMALLAGCSSGGGEEDGGGNVVPSSGLLTTDLPPESEWSSLPAGISQLLGDFKTANETLDPSTLPATGSASYAGTAGFEIDNGDGTFTYLVSDAEINANFGDPDPVTGTFSRFVGSDDAGPLPAITGTVNMGASSLDSSTATFTAGIAGTLTAEGENYGIGGNVQGAFGGTDKVLGVIEGNVSNPDSSSDQMNGLFIATNPTP